MPTDQNPETYEVFAIRYATAEERGRCENFVIADPHDGPMPLDFFVWAIVNENRTIVVDTGFDHEEAARRGRELNQLPAEGLAKIGIDTSTVKDVIITHLHHDHAGTSSDFPNASFHLQDLEIAYATGRYMTHAPLRMPYSVEHIVDFVRHLYNDRVVFHDGDDEIAPGISVHYVGGHTNGMQVVRVFTKRGWVVLASDASHYYENMEKLSPFPILHSVGDVLEGYKKMNTLADSYDHIVPGHDPLVMQRYPAPSPELEGYVVRLDVPPINT